MADGESHSRKAAGAHAIDRTAGDFPAPFSQYRDHPPDGATLFLDLVGYPPDAVFNHFGLDGRVTLDQGFEQGHTQILGPGIPEDAFFACSPKGGPYGIDDHNII